MGARPETGAVRDDLSSDDRPELRYRALFDWAAPGMAVTDLDGRFLAANPALCRMLGYREDELRERNFLEITHPDDRATNQQLHHELLTGRRPSFVIEKRYRTRSGDDVWARVSVALIRDTDRAPLYVASTVEDITAHREASAQLGLSQSLLRIAGRRARVGGWAIAVPSQELFWSDEIFEILEAPRSDEPTLPAGYELYPPADREVVRAAVEACARDGEPFDIEVRTTTFTGRPLWVRIVAEPERAPDGTIVRVTGAFQDVSELRAAHAETEEVAERLTVSLESMTDALYLLDHDWCFTYLNRQAEQLLRAPREDLLGRNAWELFPEAVDLPVYEAFHRAVREDVPIALDDLYYPPLEAWFAHRIYPTPKGLAVYFRNVTDQHEAMLALAERESKLAEQAALLDETQEAIFVQDLDGIVTYWNRSAERLYGPPAEDAVGRGVAELVAGDVAHLQRATRTTLTEGVWNGEVPHRTQDGRDLVIEARWTLLRDADGAPRSILVSDTDVTESRRIEHQLIRSQRMESIGTLAGGIAHDLNNVLAPILLAIDLLADAESDPRRAELLQTIQGSAERGAAMVRQVLAFARGVSGERVELDLTRLVGNVLQIVAETFPRGIELETELQLADGLVLGDETQLHQVLMNLMVNARDALPEGGTIRCSVSLQEITGEQVHLLPLAPGRWVRLAVEDDGVGMSSEVVDRIFEPFFTTKRQGEGTGLGLPTSLAIVRSHGGHLTVESEPGRGTTFRVFLPVHQTLGPSTVTEAPPPVARGNGELVLVVDDEAAVREVVSQTLRAAGYGVLTASDGAEAVAFYQQRRGEIALVITDLMMPVMDGSATIEALRGIDATVLIIAASGLSDPPGPGEGAAPEVDHLIAKPFTAHQLLRVTAEALARR
jgi:two-component system, cell cycle sensor histidine kinase and response regulator CckA